MQQRRRPYAYTAQAPGHINCYLDDRMAETKGSMHCPRPLVVCRLAPTIAITIGGEMGHAATPAASVRRAPFPPLPTLGCRLVFFVPPQVRLRVEVWCLRLFGRRRHAVSLASRHVMLCSVLAHAPSTRPSSHPVAAISCSRPLATLSSSLVASHMQPAVPLGHPERGLVMAAGSHV
ncbi:hypothetical protein ACCO45_008212 [Purpureocillium lilacinum]|uniref:Uncharacterized protein n=1 Tax=Purpureocillium lilacinum TaxID=33203 RepID=A0ACC4DMV1_PURLI